MAEAAASLRNVSHTWYPSGVRACLDVSLDLRSSSIHALVGENGAGKSTLGSILAGVLKPDSGSLRQSSGTTSLSDRHGGLFGNMGLIRQRSIWPRALTVLEAAVLGRKDCPRSVRGQETIFRNTAEEWELDDISPETPVALMGAAALQRAEMIAALMFDPDILILDEPSSAWEEGRSGEFFRLLNQLRNSGRGVLLITHRLEDVFRIADTVTVMRQGAAVFTGDAADTDYAEITKKMFGETAPNLGKPISEGTEKRRKAHTGTSFGDSGTLLEVEGIGFTRAGIRKLDNISFQLSKGEILGIAGLREEGLSALEDIISGNQRPDTGSILVDSKPVPGGSAGMRKSGLHYVPSDKTGRGASLGSTMSENMIILESGRLARRGWLHPQRIRKWTESRRTDGDITGSPDQKLDELSGGNIQKVILQREINTGTRLLVVADPAWGLDERSRQKIHLKLKDIRDNGAGVLLLASDLDEALELSDRMGVISGGRLSEMRPPEEWDRDDAAALITGGHA